jgi:hypothetical protein
VSLFKKLKNKVTSPKARILLRLDKNSYALGENAEATLAVSSEEEFEAREIRAEIQCVEKAKRVVYQYDSMVKHDVPRQVEESRTLYFAKPPATGLTHITQGFSQMFPLSISIPAAGTPTLQNIDARVWWQVKGVIAIDGRPDVTSQPIEIQVTPPSAQQATQEKEVIRDVVVIKTPCKNCGALMPETDTYCPNCGAKRT